MTTGSDLAVRLLAMVARVSKRRAEKQSSRARRSLPAFWNSSTALSSSRRCSKYSAVSSITSAELYIHTNAESQQVCTTRCTASGHNTSCRPSATAAWPCSAPAAAQSNLLCPASPALSSAYTQGAESQQFCITR